MPLIRLQKIIANAGITSRRKAETLIVQGRVMVNGAVVQELGTKADPESDIIKVDGKLVGKSQPKYYYLAFNPSRMITSLSDPQGRVTIADMLRQNRIRTRVYPAGRLDWDAEGLLLLTNDGELAHNLMHPRTHIPKVYQVKVKGVPDENDITRLQKGIRIEKGIITLPAKVYLEKEGRGVAWLRITLIEGRNNQIKSMCERISHPVLYLRRIAIGPLKITGLRRGQVRQMTRRELQRLKKAIVSNSGKSP